MSRADRDSRSASALPQESNQLSYKRRPYGHVRTLPGGKPIQVLLVDDDPGDVRLTIEDLKESKLHTHIDIVEDGREVLAFDVQPL